MKNIVYIVYAYATHSIYGVYSKEKDAIKRKEEEERDLAMGGYHNNTVRIVKEKVL